MGYVHSKYSQKCASLFFTLLKIRVTTESEDIFPPVVCNSCYLTLKKTKEDETNILTTPLSMFAWEPHNDLCDLCLVVGGESSGGRPKRKRKGRPRDDEPTFQRRNVIGRIGDIDSPEFATFRLDRSLFLPSPYLDDLSCYNCHCIANQPVEVTTCHHHLCMECMKGGLMACPCNENTFLAEHINSPSPLTLKLLGSLLVHCNNTDCVEVMELKHLMAHISSSCQHTTVPPPSSITVSQLLHQGSKESLMASHTMGLIAETAVPSSGHITFKSQLGKVRITVIILITIMTFIITFRP